jgi:subtilase family serine protease
MRVHRGLNPYFGIAGLLCAPAILAAPADRVTAAIDDNQLVTIPGHVRRLAPAYVDQGPLPPAQHLELALHLKPSARQKADLDRLLIELQDPASPRYHSWITPEQYADRFAISAVDAAKITIWLESQGFHVSSVGRARSLVVFDGTAGEVEAAFHSDLRQYRSPTATHFANASNPSIPRALADIVQWIGGLDDFLPVPVQQAAKPAYTNPNGAHTLSPGDLAVIYDFQALLSSGIDGTGQNVVIAGQSDIHQSDFQAWAARYHVAVPNVQVTLVPGYADPGFTNSLVEADLDMEEVAAAARNATIWFVYSTNAYTAVGYAIDQDLAPVINASFSSGCDRSASISEMTSYQSLAQQGNAQGITWLNPSGDSGAAGCDPETEQEAVSGLATQFPADIPEVTAVGGTEFNE